LAENRPGKSADPAACKECAARRHEQLPTRGHFARIFSDTWLHLLQRVIRTNPPLAMKGI
jgi:hypothetical protein